MNSSLTFSLPFGVLNEPSCWGHTPIRKGRRPQSKADTFKINVKVRNHEQMTILTWRILSFHYWFNCFVSLPLVHTEIKTRNMVLRSNEWVIQKSCSKCKTRFLAKAQGRRLPDPPGFIQTVKCPLCQAHVQNYLTVNRSIKPTPHLFLLARHSRPITAVGNRYFCNLHRFRKTERGRKRHASTCLCTAKKLCFLRSVGRTTLSLFEASICPSLLYQSWTVHSKMNKANSRLLLNEFL